MSHTPQTDPDDRSAWECINGRNDNQWAFYLGGFGVCIWMQRCFNMNNRRPSPLPSPASPSPSPSPFVTASVRHDGIYAWQIGPDVPPQSTFNQWCGGIMPHIRYSYNVSLFHSPSSSAISTFVIDPTNNITREIVDHRSIQNTRALRLHRCWYSPLSSFFNLLLATHIKFKGNKKNLKISNSSLEPDDAVSSWFGIGCHPVAIHIRICYHCLVMLLLSGALLSIDHECECGCTCEHQDVHSEWGRIRTLLRSRHCLDLQSRWWSRRIGWWWLHGDHSQSRIFVWPLFVVAHRIFAQSSPFRSRWRTCFQGQFMHTKLPMARQCWTTRGSWSWWFMLSRLWWSIWYMHSSRCCLCDRALFPGSRLWTQLPRCVSFALWPSLWFEWGNVFKPLCPQCCRLSKPWIGTHGRTWGSMWNTWTRVQDQTLWRCV